MISADATWGFSPVQIADGRESELRACPAPVNRWIAAACAGMPNAELLRKLCYKPGREHAEVKPTSYEPERSDRAFSALPGEEHVRACEMDTVIGFSGDSWCILALYLRLCKLQVCLLLPGKSLSTVAAVLDMLERVL